MKSIKRVSIAILTVLMSFILCVNAYAQHMSSWVYSTLVPNYGTRIIVDTGTSISSTAYINFAGATDDINAFVEVCIKYSSQSETDYVYLETSKGIDEAYDYADDAEMRKDITSVSTDDLNVLSGSTVMHTYGMSAATVTDFVYDPEYGDYHRDTLFATSEEIPTLEHNAGQCYICDYWH